VAISVVGTWAIAIVANIERRIRGIQRMVLSSRQMSASTIPGNYRDRKHEAETVFPDPTAILIRKGIQKGKLAVPISGKH
jgi:hypothetical protein